MAVIRWLALFMTLFTLLTPNEVVGAKKNSGLNFDFSDGLNFGDSLADMVGSYLQNPSKLRDDFQKIVKPFADSLTDGVQPSRPAKSTQPPTVIKTVVCKQNNKGVCPADLLHVLDEYYAQKYPETYQRLGSPTCDVDECSVVIQQPSKPRKVRESVKKQTDIFDVIKDAQQMYQDLVNGRSFDYGKVFTQLDFFVDNPGMDSLLFVMLENFASPQLPMESIKNGVTFLLEAYRKLKAAGEYTKWVRVAQNLMFYDKLTDKIYLKSVIFDVLRSVGTQINPQRYENLIDSILDAFTKTVKSIGGEFIAELMSQNSYNLKIEYVKNLIFAYPFKEINSGFIKYKSLPNLLMDIKNKIPDFIDESSSAQAERFAGLERKIVPFAKSFEKLSREIRTKLNAQGTRWIKEMNELSQSLRGFLKEMRQISKLMDEKLEIKTNVRVTGEMKKFSELLEVELNRWNVALKIHESSHDLNNFNSLAFWADVRTFLIGIPKFKVLMDGYDAIVVEVLRLMNLSL
ncbi:hypothetical protein CHUAL_002949 [Chamberlinius hualienensis]